MNLKNVNLKDTYWTGEDNLIEEFYVPCLKNSIYYDRAVGYFSSSILKYISDGLYDFIKNGGKMRLICSIELSENDLDEINQGYEIRGLLKDNLDKKVKELLLDKNRPNVQNLCWLIKNKRLDVKICLRDSNNSDTTLFHEKFGIFKDEKGNQVSFMGSINESIRGWYFNEESFEVSYSWEKILQQRVANKIDRFEKLWNGVAKDVKTYDFPVELKDKLKKVAPDRPINRTLRKNKRTNKVNKDFKPRKCQENALKKYKHNDHVCMFQMATGAGKTLAALYSFKETENWKFLLILVPNTELIDQWEKDINFFFSNSYIIKCSSDFQWKEPLLDLIQAKVPTKSIVISTYDSAITDFALDKWGKVNSEIFGIICDEAHNLGSKKRQKLMEIKPKFRIGLSATPKRNFDEKGTEKIFNYFNNNVYTFTISEAIKEGYLVEYEYNVYPCFLNRDEWEEYLKLTKEIRRMRNYISISKNEEEDVKEDNRLEEKYRKRAGILKTAQGKLDVFPKIMNSISKDKRLLIYADSKEHLYEYANELDSLNRDYFIYTGDKDKKKERPLILEEFKLGVRKILLAIKCLDEGIDIPSCDSAIFISSSTSKRQFIQRRGRSLRSDDNKNRAYIYDYIVIPNFDHNNEFETKIARQVVKKEYERINIIANDAINGTTIKNQLDRILDKYGVNIYKF